MPPTILCAQEDRNLFRIHEQALRAEGFNVLGAHDGEQALAIVDQEWPDLVLLDVLLPKRDGFEVLAAIRARTAGDAPVPGLLLCPGRISPQYRERVEGFGAAKILSKPIALDVLIEQVRALAKPASRLTGEAGGGVSGSLKDVDFAALLHQLHGLRASGVLLLQNGKKKKAIQFTDGYPVAVKSNLITECLGNILVQRGDLDASALEESLLRVKRGEGLQGEILVAMEVLDEEAVSEALREQAESKLFEIFRWKRGRFQLQQGRTLQRGNTLALDRSPANIVVEGARKHVPLRSIDDFLARNARRFVVRGESPFYRFQSIDLSAEEERVISGLDGSHVLSEFAGADESVRRTLYALLMTELLELRGEDEAEAAPVAASVTRSRLHESRHREEQGASREELAAMAKRMRGQNHYEVLGLPTTADDDGVRDAYEKLVARVHPDRFANASGAVRQLADEVYRLVSRAQEEIADAERRAAYAEELALGAKEQKSQARGKKALAAETAFQQAEAALRARNFEEALVLFGRAMEQFPEEGEYHAHYGWCLHLCHPDNVVMIQEAIEHVQRGIKLARDREKPYLFLGRLYKAVGKASAAEKMFTRAVQIRPDCVEAMRELRLMNMRRDKGKGLLGRLLRR